MINIVVFGDESGIPNIMETINQYDELRVRAIVYSKGRIAAKDVARQEALKIHCEYWEQPSAGDKTYRSFCERVQNLSADYGVCFSYDRIIKKEILEAFPQGIYNLHGALLPKYRGGNVLQWVLINGEEKTGVTMHKMVERVDAGPIVIQREVQIAKDDTAVSLREKQKRVAKEILKDFFVAIADHRLTLIPQNEAEATHFRKRKPEDGEFSWEDNPEKIYNLIRALVLPWPGARFYHEGKLHIIDQFMPFDKVVKLREKYLASDIK